MCVYIYIDAVFLAFHNRLNFQELFSLISMLLDSFSLNPSIDVVCVCFYPISVVEVNLEPAVKIFF